MKKAKAANPRASIGNSEAELRRWCVEQAIRWPTIGGYGYGSAVQGGGHVPATEANILDRAARLLKWVTGAEQKPLER